MTTPLLFVPKPSKHDLGSVLLLLFTGALIYGWVAVGSFSATGFSDSIDYLFLADFYKTWLSGEQAAHATELYRNTRYPPVFPLILAAFGAGTDSQQSAAFVSCSIAVVAALAIWIWVRRQEPQNPSLSAFIAFALLTYPGYFVLNLYVVSEPLAMALLALAFWHLSKPTGSFSALATSALLIGAATLVRTASAAAIPALLIYLIIAMRHTKLHTCLAVTLAAAPLATWSLYRSSTGSESYADYLTVNSVMTNLGGWPDMLWLPAWNIVLAMSKNWGFPDSVVMHAASTLLLLLAATGCAIRVRRNHVDGWFLLAYMAMIIVWPFPDELARFMTLAFPFLLVSAASAAEVLTQYGKSRQSRFYWRFAPAGLAILLLAAALPAAVKYANRAALAVDPALISEKREAEFFRVETNQKALTVAEMIARVRILSSELPNHVPAGECVYTLFPQLIQLHGRVPAFAYPDGLRTMTEARERLRMCDYFMVVGFTAVQLRHPPLYPFPLLKEWTEPLLVSNMSNGESSITAAALLRRIPNSPQNDSKPLPKMEGLDQPKLPERFE